MKLTIFTLSLLAMGACLSLAGEKIADVPESAVFENVLGGEFHLPQGGDSVATVLVFFGHDCPMSNGYVPEINRLCKEFVPQKVAFCVVYADSDLKMDEAAKHAKEYGFVCPAILDPKLILARTYSATVKPEVVVLSPEQKMLYRGRIDDRYVDFGKQRAEPTVRELHAALAAVLAGKPIAVTRAKAIGCDIHFPK